MCDIACLIWIHFCETGTSLFIMHSVTEVVCSETLYLPDLRKFHVWIETVQKKSSQSTIISNIKVRVDRNSTIIFSKQRFFSTYLQQTLTNVSNSSKKKQTNKKKTPKKLHSFPTFLQKVKQSTCQGNILLSVLQNVVDDAPISFDTATS